MKRSMLVLLLISIAFAIFAQQPDLLTYPEVGKPMPDFVIQHIKYYPKQKAFLSDFKGKWLMLDFWNKGCGACVASFPKVNDIQNNLGIDLQVMMVGIQDREGQIQSKYKRYKDKLHLSMPCAFDSALAERFDIYTAPHIVLIDDKGIVRCITTTINTADLRQFLSGNPPDLPKTYRRMHDENDPETLIPYDPQKPFLVNNNGAKDSDFLFRSAISKWDRNIHNGYYPSKINEFNDGRFEILGSSLEDLYKFAYMGLCRWDYRDTVQYGVYYDKIILEITDSSLFKASYKYNKNLFSYSLIFPKLIANQTSMENAMQKDLETYFGYEAGLERRSVPCWRLVASHSVKERLQTKGGPATISRAENGSLTIKNWSIRELLTYLGVNNMGIVLDETGITGKIDIFINDMIVNPEDIKKVLEASGLQFLPSTKEMQTLVIREKRNTNSGMSIR